jgi:hypothetical protein
MAKFKIGDKVRVRLDSPSPYRGRTGVVHEELSGDPSGFRYMVKFELRGLAAVNRFAEKDLEAMSD